MEKGKYCGRVSGNSSVILTLTDNLYVLYTWRDTDIFTTMSLITKYWDGTPSVQTLYEDSASKVTVTAQVDDKIEIANSGSSYFSYTLKQISFDTQS